MTSLTKFFFRLPGTYRTPTEVIGWWEARRVTYNLAVGTAGLVTLVGFNVLLSLPPSPRPLWPIGTLAAAGVYGILANICYTGGWIAELLLRRRTGEELEAVGPALFRYGFVFSIGLTLFPIAIAGIDEAIRIVRWIFLR
jgi:hypothetical protein